jgi:heme/copper-type cytochrome/quinol oxidase subunit 2
MFRSRELIAWLILAIGGLAATSQSARADRDADFLQIIKDCTPATTVPFRSVADIRKEVDCVGAAIKAPPQRNPAGGQRLNLTAATGQWAYRRETGSAADNEPTCRIGAEVALLAGQPLSINLTASDTIHRLAIPALNVKADAIPGRLARIELKALPIGTHSAQMIDNADTSKAQTRLVTLRVLPEAEHALWHHANLRSGACAPR